MILCLWEDIFCKSESEKWGQTERKGMKTSRVFVSDESARHRSKAYNDSLHVSRKCRTGLTGFMVSQVPKS
jgi:hypothetical protein